jgi:hypothetical protein
LVHAESRNRFARRRFSGVTGSSDGRESFCRLAEAMGAPYLAFQAPPESLIDAARMQSTAIN